MATKHIVKAVLAVPVKQKAPPKGLQLSAAQWKAYNAAYNAYASAAYRTQAAAQRRSAINAAALSLRRSRLSAAYSMGKKAAAAHAVARTAAIAAFAVKMSLRQSGLAHQNQALHARIYNDFNRHMQALGRAQFVYKGEKVWAHTAVMSTLTNRQALTIEQARFAQAAKTAKKAIASTRPGAPSAASAAIAAGARAAGLAAAMALPGPQLTARQKAHRTAHNTASKHARTKAHNTAHNTASKHAKQTIKRDKAARAAAKKKHIKYVKPAPRAASSPLPVKVRPPGMRRWRGDPEGCDCLAAAVANSLLRETRYRLDDEDYEAFLHDLGPDAQIADALAILKWEFPFGSRAVLTAYEPDTLSALPGAVIGFQTENGPHAALYLGRGRIASWGEEIPLSTVMLGGVEEAWNLTWAVS